MNIKSQKAVQFFILVFYDVTCNPRVYIRTHFDWFSQLEDRRIDDIIIKNFSLRVFFFNEGKFLKFREYFTLLGERRCVMIGFSTVSAQREQMRPQWTFRRLNNSTGEINSRATRSLAGIRARHNSWVHLAIWIAEQQRILQTSLQHRFIQHCDHNL